MLAPPDRCQTFHNDGVLTRHYLVAECTTGEKSRRKGDPAGSSTGPAYSREKPDSIMGSSSSHQSVPQSFESMSFYSPTPMTKSYAYKTDVYELSRCHFNSTLPQYAGNIVIYRTAELDKANAPSGLTGKRTVATMTSFSEDGTCKKTVPQPDPGTHVINSSTAVPSNRPEQQAEGETLPTLPHCGPTRWTSPEEEEHRREHIREMDNFVINAARLYDDMLKNLQISCRTEAEKHDIDAASYQRICHNLETVGRVLGTVSLAGIVRFMVEWFSSSTKANADADTNLTSIGLLAFSGVAITGVVQFLSKGSARLLPTFKMRANEHRVVTFGWQQLKHEIKATRIGLRNPEVDLKEVEKMYKEHVAKRKELSEQILVSEQTSDQTKSHPALLKTDEEKSFLAQWPVDQLRRDRGERNGDNTDYWGAVFKMDD